MQPSNPSEMKNEATGYTHRQRVEAALNHKPADRVPLTMGSPSSSLHRDAHHNLLKYLGFSQSGPEIITDNILQIVKTDPRIIETFDIDLVWLLPHLPEVEWNEDRTELIDEFGRTFRAGGGFFNHVGVPFPEASFEALSRYSFPVLPKSLFAHLGAEAKNFYERGYGIGIDGPWGIYEISSSLVGLSEYMVTMAIDPELAIAIAEDVLEKYMIPFYELLLADTASYVNVVGISDDLGSQTGLLFSPAMYRKIFKPLHRRLIEFIRSKTDARIYMHSDGSIYDIIPDLIEIGVDGLNPVQYTAKGMELERLVREFGKDLGFYGGVVENEILSFSPPEEITELARRNVAILKQEKAFIFAPIHNISQEVPPENIVALYQAGLAFGKY